MIMRFDFFSVIKKIVGKEKENTCAWIFIVMAVWIEIKRSVPTMWHFYRIKS